MTVDALCVLIDHSTNALITSPIVLLKTIFGDHLAVTTDIFCPKLHKTAFHKRQLLDFDFIQISLESFFLFPLLFSRGKGGDHGQAVFFYLVSIFLITHNRF